MSTQGEVLLTGDKKTDKVTKTEKGIDMALRTMSERDTEETGTISASLAQKLMGYGFVQHDMPIRNKAN